MAGMVDMRVAVVTEFEISMHCHTSE